MMQIVKDIGGVELPEFLGKLATEGNGGDQQEPERIPVPVPIPVGEVPVPVG
jgi:hypothetical protein